MTELDEYGQDPDDHGDDAFLARLKVERDRLGRLLADYDAAVGFTRSGDLATSAALSSLDAVIAAEEDHVARSAPDEPPDPPQLRSVE